MGVFLCILHLPCSLLPPHYVATLCLHADSPLVRTTSVHRRACAYVDGSVFVCAQHACGTTHEGVQDWGTHHASASSRDGGRCEEGRGLRAMIVRGSGGLKRSMQLVLQRFWLEQYAYAH